MFIRDELDDLQYYCSKDYASKGKKEKQLAKFYRWCRRIWVFMIVNTVIAVPVVSTFFRQRIPMPLFIIYLVLSLVTIIVSVVVWFIVTKDNR